MSHIQWFRLGAGKVVHGFVKDGLRWRAACKPRTLYHNGDLKPSSLLDAECRKCRATFNAYPEMENPDDYALDPRGPDHSRPPPFDYHNCARCGDGARPCVNGDARRCDWLHARND